VDRCCRVRPLESKYVLPIVWRVSVIYKFKKQGSLLIRSLSFQIRLLLFVFTLLVNDVELDQLTREPQHWPG